MTKIRLLTDGNYTCCKAGDILEVTEWCDEACEAFVPLRRESMFFLSEEFEIVEDDTEPSYVEGVYVVVYDGDSVEGPVDYDNALFIWQTYVEEGYDARIAKLTWLD